MEPVLYAAADGVALVTLNRPDQRNAISPVMAEALRAAIEQAEADADVRVVVLTGAGTFFCAGMDLAAFADGARVGLGDPDGFAHFVSWPRKKPIIAAVNGGALAGGFEMMLGCDIAIAADGAIFGLPEVKRGIMAAGGGIFRLARSVPPSIANTLLLTGDPISADRAQSLGLVSTIVPPETLLDAAMEMAGKITANAPLAVSLTLSLSKSARFQHEDELWARNNRFWQQIDGSDDALEGARAFKEKRAPQWRGF